MADYNISENNTYPNTYPNNTPGYHQDIFRPRTFLKMLFKNNQK